MSIIEEHILRIFQRSHPGISFDDLRRINQRDLDRLLNQYAREYGFRNVPISVDNLIDMLIIDYYMARTMSLYPGLRKDVSDYLVYGIIPSNDPSLKALSIILADIDWTLYNLKDKQLKLSLKDWYREFARYKMQSGS